MPPYYQSEDLARWSRIADAAPGLWEAFQGYYAKVFEDGALSAREKALVAVAVAHVLPCAYCIDAMTRSALERGSTVEQLTEAVHVASAIASGATLAHAVQMKKIVDELSFEGDQGVPPE